MMRFTLWLGLAAAAACGPTSNSKPGGTSSDPVAVCERVADVCRIDKAKLGVCVQARSGGFACQSQH
ncbi:MAG: hypothetical protein M3680_35125 [Myxococcota bacterium]|nr:hypothetical protein [Myxococcota bacterium]